MTSQNIKQKMSDVEFCIALAPEAGDDYRLALQVMTAYPDYAKTKFRIVIEHLVVLLAKKFKVASQGFDLYRSINELYEYQIIDNSLCSELHTIRKLGNEVVHAKLPENNRSDGTEEESKISGAGDLQSAIAARKTLLGIFERVFRLIKKDEELPEITIVEVGEITSQQTLWKAVSSMDFEAKMASGLILEAQSLTPIPKQALFIGRSEDAHRITTRKMAAELYWAACVISARVDRFTLVEIELKGGEDACLFSFANTEALFRYSLLTVDLAEGEEYQRRGVKALEVAANRGHVPACAEYGNYLREKGLFDEAFKFLSIALVKGDLTCHAGLGFLYLEKAYSNYSQKLAEQSFENGIASGSSHCEYILGRLLYEGKELELDKERGKALLKSAAEAGHAEAQHYMLLIVDDKAVKHIQAGLKRFAKLLKKTMVPQVHEVRSGLKKQGRNDPCACNSGKKYKKCCGA